MQIESGISDLGMAEQYLNGAQVGAGFQHVSREAVSKQMGRNALADAGAFTSFVHSLAAQLRVVPLLNGRVEGVHVDMHNLPPAHPVSMVGQPLWLTLLDRR